MNLMKQILLSVGLLLASVAVWGQTKSFQVDEPGTLNQVIPGDVVIGKVLRRKAS